jgi:hypothetical protein
MKVLPYQELFIRQEQALGSSLSNQLVGIAEIKHASFDRLAQSVDLLLKERIWPYLKLSEDLTSWVIDKNQRGIFNLNKTEGPELSLSCLWAINLYQINDQITLKLCLHHVLADAHSFQLFWEDLKGIYEGKEPVRTSENKAG